jgi:hypothetical protein
MTATINFAEDPTCENARSPGSVSHLMKFGGEFALFVANHLARIMCKRRSNNPSLKRPDIPVAPE